MSSWRITYIILAIFGVAATTFALGRVPFDDEWFSLTLLSEASDEAFWRSLARDMHPPWLAMLDRGIWSLWPDRLPLVGMRVLACVLAASLWLSILRPFAGRRPWLLALALCHPIVFYYAGAQRWYAFLMLGHALRHWAILSSSRASHRGIAFVSGAFIGAASGYVDLLFFVHDALHYGWRERSDRKRAAATLLASSLAISLLFFASPMASEHWAIFSHQVQKSWPMLNVLLWAGLGPVGEAMPHVFFLLAAPCVVVIALLGARLFLNAGLRSQAGWLVLSLSLTWLFATRFGIWSPRYSLELWWLMTLGVLAPFVYLEAQRLWALCASAFIVLGLMSTLSGHLFFKADLNKAPAQLCDELSSGASIDAYVIPYHRISAQIRTLCRPSVEIVDPPEMRHVSSAEELLRGVRARVDEGGRIALVATTSQAGISRTRRHVKSLLAARCVLSEKRSLWPPSHPWIREHLIEGPPYRLEVSEYICPSLDREN